MQYNNEQQHQNTPDSKIKELEENLPEDIKEALNVIVGNRPKSFDEEFSPKPGKEKEFDGAAFGGTSSQEEFIKKKDLMNIIWVPQKRDIIRYEEVMDQVFDPENDVQLVEPVKEPQYIIDPNSPTGVRALLIIKTTVPIEYIKKEGTGYTVVNKQNKKS